MKRANQINLLISLLLYLTILPAHAQELADSIRGGWMSDEGEALHTFIFVVKDTGVSGVYCTACYNPDNLAIIDDGTLTNNGLNFSIYHDEGNGELSIQQAKAVLQGEVLQLTLEGMSTIKLIRAPRDLRAAAPSGGFAPARPYDAPGIAIELSPDVVAGLWLAGSGPGKQYFIFKQHKNGLRGMACGPCDDAKHMASIENVRIEGTQLYFDIMHENSGPGVEEYGPHSNVTVASIFGNEFHFATRPSFEPESYSLIHMTLLGPVEFKPN